MYEGDNIKPCDTRRQDNGKERNEVKKRDGSY